MTDLLKHEEIERRHRRRQLGGALGAALIATGGIAAIAGIQGHEREHHPPVRVASSPPPPVPRPAPVASPVVPAPIASPQVAPTPMPSSMPATTPAPSSTPAPATTVFAAVDDQSLALTPADATPVDHLAKADLLEKSGDRKGALVEVREALAGKPDDPTLLWRIATLDATALGERALEELLTVSKSDIDAPRELARRRLARNDAKDALPAAIEACRRAPKSWEAWELEGRALLATGRLGPAVEAFRKSSEQAGAPSWPFNNLGLALMLSGRYDDALPALNTAVERGPVTAFMMNNLGLANEKLGRLDDAEVAFLGALELKSDYVKAQVNLERVGTEKDALAQRDADQKAADARRASAGERGATSTGHETAAQSSGALVSEPGPLHGG